MDKLSIHQQKIYAYHGCHPLEQKVGGEFEVDVDLYSSFDACSSTDQIEHAIDYVQVMDVIAAQMKVRRDLIETVAEDLAKVLKQQFPSVVKVRVRVRKLKPPVAHELTAVSVEIER